MAGAAVCSLTLSHFRSYKSLKLETVPQPIAFFGANGVGKTNILEAVSLLSPGRGLRRARAPEMSRHPENLGWKIEATFGAAGSVQEISTWATGDTARRQTIDGKAAAQSDLGRLVRLVWLVPSMDRIWLEGAEGRRRFVDRMTLSFFPAHADVSLAYEKAMRERNRLLKDRVNDVAWFQALETQMAEAAINIDQNRRTAIKRLMRAQESTAQAFPRADLTLTSRDDQPTPGTAADLTAHYHDTRSRDLHAGRTLTGPHRADLSAIYVAKSLDARQCSTGEQKALLISLILANARAIADEHGAPPLILLDEVAAHLDTSRRSALYDAICALKAQAWMTGTDAGLFQALAGRATFYEVTETAQGAHAIQREVT